MSSKRERHAAVLEVIRETRVVSQDSLVELLHERGIDVTQATVSRDVRELRLVKAPDAEGVQRYILPDEWESTPPLETLLPTLYQSAEGTRNLLVVKTMTGGAQAIGLAIDWEEWPEVLGTLAGDDTILVICRQDDQIDTVKARLEEIAETGRR